MTITQMVATGLLLVGAGVVLAMVIYSWVWLLRGPRR